LNSQPLGSPTTRVRQACLEIGIGDGYDACEFEPGIWRVNTSEKDLVVKLFFGPAAEERIRTEVGTCQELSRMGAPVPANAVAVMTERALARDWIPGVSLRQWLFSVDPPTAAHGEIILDAWHDLILALNQFYGKIPMDRRGRAKVLRTQEIRFVAQAVAHSFPRITSEDIDQLHKTIVSGELSMLPLDASAANLILGESIATFVDLELLGIDFTDWTFAKFLTTTQTHGNRTQTSSLLQDLPHLATANLRLEAATALLLLAIAADLWKTSTISLVEIAKVFPTYSALTRRISTSLV
jgi:hypothetical protein